MTDVCLCTATSHGHCGLVEHGPLSTMHPLIDCARLQSHMQAGADYVCASDMMDGRVSAIRPPPKLQIIRVRGLVLFRQHASSFMGRFVMLQTQAQNSVIVQRIK